MEHLINLAREVNYDNFSDYKPPHFSISEKFKDFSSQDRYITADRIENKIIDGKKYCAWCREKEVRGRKKYCSNTCKYSCYAFINPTSIFGLNYLFKKQMGRCSICGFSFTESFLNKLEVKKSSWHASVIRNSIHRQGIFNLKFLKRFCNIDIDHIRPVATCGSTVGFDNLQIICRYPCHKDKTKIDMKDIREYKLNMGV